MRESLLGNSKFILLLALISLLIGVIIENAQTSSIPTDSSCNLKSISRTKGFRKVVEKVRQLIDWKTYQRVFGKRYGSLTEALFRLKLFTARSLNVVRQLLRCDTSYYLEINKLSDKSEQELRKFHSANENDAASLHLNADEESSESEQSINALPRERSKRSVDQSKNTMMALLGSIGKMFGGEKCPEAEVAPSYDHSWLTETPTCFSESMIDQGECGCCYAMASMKLFEWLHCQKTGGKFVKLSEQYLINCGREPQGKLLGCESGNADSTIKFINKYGLLPDERLAYEARDGECPKSLLEDANLMKPKVSKLSVVKKPDWLNELRRQPLIAYLITDEDFNYYAGGIYQVPKCRSPRDGLGHFVLLVGSGKDQASGEEFWLLSNSFGSSWGENGYFRLSKKNPCILYLAKVDADFF